METSESFTPEPVDEDAGATGEVPSDEGEGKERQKETPPLDDSGSGPRWRSGSFDGARLQLVELLVIARAHLLEEPTRARASDTTTGTPAKRGTWTQRIGVFL